MDFKGLCLSGNHQTWLSDKNQRQSGYPQKKTDLKGFSHPPNQRQQHTHTKKADPPHIPTGLERHGQGHVEREHRGEQRVHRHQRRRQLPPADAPGDSPELIPIGKDQGLPERTDGVGSKRMGTQKSLCLCWSQKRGDPKSLCFFLGFPSDQLFAMAKCRDCSFGGIALPRWQTKETISLWGSLFWGAHQTREKRAPLATWAAFAVGS